MERIHPDDIKAIAAAAVAAMDTQAIADAVYRLMSDPPVTPMGSITQCIPSHIVGDEYLAILRARKAQQKVMKRSARK